MTELPKILVVLGAPDAMAATPAEERERNLHLSGNSGLVSALVRTLRARGLPHVVVIAWPDGDTEGESLVATTGVEVLVNAICEPLTQRGALQQLARLEQETGLPTLNPARVVATTARPDVARRVGRADGVRAPHCTLYETGAGPLVEHVRAAGHRYPVLLRPAGSHGSSGLVRAGDETDVAAAARAVGTCTVTDFVDFRSEDGLWRKHRMVYAGGRLFRRHLLVDEQWNVVGESRYFMHERGLFAEELEWLARPVVDTDPIEARVLEQFQAMELDFGVIDYAVLPDGELVIFEMNACVQLTGTIPEQYRSEIGYIEDNNDEILAALMDRVRRRAAADPPVRGAARR
ncbi:MAG: hypothetical protein Q8K79_03320 [Solirubrobacteraceae bacterium]|nr:hypothetical protein [Solirubrobacteraceae bacterium]